LLSYWIPVSALAVALALAVACFVIEFRRRPFRWLLMYAALLAFQPGWDLVRQELHGGGIRVRADCGYGQRSLSLFLLGATVALLIILVRRLSVKRRSFIFGLALAFSLMCLLETSYMFLWFLVPRILEESTIFQEIHSSLFTGFGGRPMDMLVLVVICLVLYVIQRWPVRTQSHSR
jgi:hypothetical protein